SLVVFQDTIVPETVNLETLTLAVASLGLYALIVVGLWGLAYLFWPAYPAKWFWHDESRRRAYRASWTINAFFVAVWVVRNVRTSAAGLLIGTGVLAALAGITTFALVAHGGQAAKRRAWQRDFFLARTALLVVTAIAPAVACFRAAYEFETRLYIK